MRVEGRIETWKDDKGFGFIRPAGGGESVFVHVKSFVNREKRPVGNEVVTYELTFDARKRPRATNVVFAHQRMATPPSPGYGTRKPSAPPDKLTLPVLVSIGFLALLVWMSAARKVHFAVPLFYTLASLVAFLVYADDKNRAERRKRRTPESTLHLIAVLCGWPGAWIAQRVFRHKSKKTEFQTNFWITVILNCVVLMFVTSPTAREVVYDLTSRIRR